MLNAARNDKQVLIGHRLFIVDDKKKNQLDKKMVCLAKRRGRIYWKEHELWANSLKVSLVTY